MSPRADHGGGDAASIGGYDIRSLFNPPEAPRMDEVRELHKMRFDEAHYQRAYRLCLASGKQPPEQCARDLMVDTYITKPNPILERYPRDIANAAACMSTYLDSSKCDYHFKLLYDKVYVAPPPHPGFARRLVKKVTGY
eukprot:GHVU01181726.1.p2 GENE.GHVU01181726.1~~GHVU01181726.1.p2  ORF type:complete len:139 (-),score=21.11 GHVU01181726.1:1281-1697(-)